MSSIEVICRKIADCEDRISTARAREPTDRDDRIAKEVEIAKLERDVIQWTAARAAWVDGGREVWRKGVTKHKEAQAANGATTKAE